MKRSAQPPFWLLFGAGGMLSALVGAMLVFLTGIAAPLGLFGAGTAFTYERAAAFAHQPLGKLAVAAVIALFLWHGAHRIYHTLHDFGVRLNAFTWLACYGVALAGTITAAVALAVV